MIEDEELEAKIREFEMQLRMEESKYIEAIDSCKNYDTLKAIKIDIRNIKEELRVLYNAHK